MGHEFEVWAFVAVDNPDQKTENESPYYDYILEYEGDSFTHAIQAMQKLKDEHVGLVKLLWR